MNVQRFLRAGLAALALGSSMVGCAPSTERSDKVTAELKPFEHAAPPADVPNPTFIDFGGKVHLVGYDVSPTFAPPGTAVKVKLYWRRVGSLEGKATEPQRGWQLFTHLESERGLLGNIDRDGELRKILTASTEGVSAFELGKVYTDEQSVQMPFKGLTPRVTLVVGVWLDANADNGATAGTRLPVVSGPTDGSAGGIVTSLSTGVARSTARAAPQG